MTPPIQETADETDWMPEDQTARGVVELIGAIPAPHDARVELVRFCEFDPSKPDRYGKTTIDVQPYESDQEIETGERRFDFSVVVHIKRYVGTDKALTEAVKRYSDRIRRTVSEATIDTGHAAAQCTGHAVMANPHDETLWRRQIFYGSMTFTYQLTESPGYHEPAHATGTAAEVVSTWPPEDLDT